MVSRCGAGWGRWWTSGGRGCSSWRWGRRAGWRRGRSSPPQTTPPSSCSLTSRTSIHKLNFCGSMFFTSFPSILRSFNDTEGLLLNAANKPNSMFVFFCCNKFTPFLWKFVLLQKYYVWLLVLGIACKYKHKKNMEYIFKLPSILFNLNSFSLYFKTCYIMKKVLSRFQKVILTLTLIP